MRGRSASATGSSGNPSAALVDAEGTGKEPGQAVEGRSLLGPGGKIEPAQHRRRVEARPAERLLKKFCKRRFEARDLGWKPGDLGSPVGAALGLQPIEHP